MSFSLFLPSGPQYKHMVSRLSTRDCHYVVQKPDTLGLMLLLLITTIFILGHGLDPLGSQDSLIQQCGIHRTKETRIYTENCYDWPFLKRHSLSQVSKTHAGGKKRTSIQTTKKEARRQQRNATMLWYGITCIPQPTSPGYPHFTLFNDFFYSSNAPPTKAQLDFSNLPLRNSYTVKVTA